MSTPANHASLLDRYTVAEETRIGARRINQDRQAHWRTTHSLLMVVADGLGGHPHGEVAAEFAVRCFGTAFQRQAQPRLADPARFLSGTVFDAHRQILFEAQRRRLHDSPRTVVVACVVQDGHAWWTHVGDCRLYLVRGKQIWTRTRDHTAVQQLVDLGRLEAAAAAVHPERNRVLRCLGGHQPPQPGEPTRTQLAKNDVVLLCSDGLWSPLQESELAEALQVRPLSRALAELALLAERRAGPQCDNVTVMAMAWD